MDQAIRNQLQRATQDARQLLEAEFAEQLEGTYDILPDGTIHDRPGTHLNDRQRLTRQKLVDAIQHRIAGGKTSTEAVADYTREAAFTFLNRFVALKMLEARELVQQCVSKSEQSSGFKEFTGLAPGLAELPDKGYRLYLECLFDELSIEVKILFDRQDAASLLWPRRQALDGLLVTLNKTDLDSVWGQDETIGWVYQYFNSSEERKKMREESQAPRNSHELAVRNQFFTPRYVVEFLTDNTLGRIWYEMRKGKTRLVDECRYMVCRPSEVFLDEGQQPPTDDSDADEDLSQAELLKKTVYVPHRPKKDPRDLRILDPACGSGHFLLYCFELLLTIYEEAWHDEESPPAKDVPGPDGKSPAKALREDYPTIEALRKALPGLILRHNLHGIEIDPRCAQIAAFALWLRAQRAFNELCPERAEHLMICRTNIVVAEPMPGEEELLEEFSSTLQPTELGDLLKIVFNQMRVAGEAGSLLRIENEIEIAVRDVLGTHGALFAEQDASQWRDAEEALLLALRRYAETVAGGRAYRCRLFSEDAARGFAFIDLCRQRYDVILMNPPFGRYVDKKFTFLESRYPNSKRDVGIAFVDRAAEMLRDGYLGALFSRKPFFIESQRAWREGMLARGASLVVADLGLGVLDDALVEVAAMAAGGRARTSVFISSLHASDKASVLRDALSSRLDGNHTHVLPLEVFRALPSQQFAYFSAPRLLAMFSNHHGMEPAIAVARAGLQTSDDERFVRLWWELPAGSASRWAFMAKGGAYSPWYSDTELCVLWDDGQGEMAAYNLSVGNEAQSRRGSRFYFRHAITYTGRTASRFAARLLARTTLFNVAGPAVIPNDKGDLPRVLAVLNSQVFHALHELCLGGGDSVSSGTAALTYTPGLLGGIPFPTEESLRHVSDAKGRALVELHAKSQTRSETSLWFCGATTYMHLLNGLESLIAYLWVEPEELLQHMWRTSAELEEECTLAYGLSPKDSRAIEQLVGNEPWSYPADESVIDDECRRLVSLGEQELVSDVSAALGNARHLVVKSYVANRRYELIAHKMRIRPDLVVKYCHERALLPCGALEKMRSAAISFVVGAAFGRWRRSEIGDLTFERLASGRELQELLVDGDDETASERPEILVDDEGHEHDLVASMIALWDEDICDEVLRASEGGRKNDRDLRDVIRKDFFAEHVARYSMHRRKAPVYWQLAVSSSAYSIWIYYRRIGKDTFYKAANDYVKPKLAHERRKFDRLRAEAGPEPTRSQRGEIDQQETFVSELKTFAEEIERIAPLWNPNLNDGVIINFAPLWRLVPQHKAWQKECKACWDKLVNGDYDWAHLAMHLWPERVVPKCRTDASLAIAHGLENVFWKQDEKGKWVAKDEPDEGWESTINKFVAERTSPAVKTALDSLLNAPAPGNSKRTRRTGKRRKKVR